jgi:ABC-2 type transport system ATP-binding protein
MVNAEDVSKSYGKYRIIDSLSLQVDAGTVYGLVGLNGAGKTTLLRLLLGIIKPNSGHISILGKIPWNHQSALYRECGVVLESDGFWGNLTAAQNCSIYAAAKGISPRELSCYLTTYWKDSAIFTGNKKVCQFSRGQRMQCALCRAFMGNASVYFLDEPVIALDLHAYEHFKVLVKNARDRGAAVIISSHQLDTIDEVCDRAGILRDGKLLEINPTGPASWFIDTTEDRAAGEVIGRSGAAAVRFDCGWRFTIANADTAIPALVAALAAAGFPVRQVRPEEQGFGFAIKTAYTTAQETRQP